MNLRNLSLGAFTVCMVVLGACNQSTNKTSTTTTMKDSITYGKLPADSAFEKTIDGKQTHLFVLKNKNGMEAAITNFGGRLVALLVPDSAGKMIDVSVGMSSVDDYIKSTERYYGATIGRYGNRIAKGHFTLEGKQYTLATNNAPNTLHGGKKGYQDVVWDAKKVNDQTLELTYLSKDMEEGFPGNLKIKVTYSLTDDNSFKCDYEATTDKTTVVNLTNHAYFNLNGEGDVLGQKLRIYASNYLEGNNQTCPTGAILPVANTPMDFTEGKLIGRDIDTGFAQTTMVGGGYDHCFVIDRARGSSQSICAWVTSEKTGISMKLYTTQPGIQLYTGNFLQDCPTPGKGGVPMQKYGGFALETQHYPCSPSHPEFPTTVLRAGKVFRATTTLRFFTGKQCGKL